ncbi:MULTISPECIES: MFS transporter [Streptomyces]|uniref:MFS transporter n=1 Tax=Streptomyces dengpaensis TaxID=2049881 RepID=A0ABN5I575_9ACTN|nr:MULTISPECIES: MFS transporter [Streptomyces]AVH58193.1 MFS transporter [Streptomyces dengpaensis]PIB08122.1 MFS transporter [Streptomyces sp. HG99]
MASTVTSRPGYGQLLRTRGAWTFLLPGFAARQPFAMLTLSIVLLVRHTTGSYGAAGAVAAVTGVSMALFAPFTGRLADRYGQRAVLLPGVLAHALAALSLTALALADAPLWALFAAAVPTGASVPQIGPMVRARWGVKLQGSPLMTTAAAFESVTDELTFVVGPLLATALCTTVDPAAGLLTEAALTLVGGLLFAAQKSTQPSIAADGHARVRHGSALRVPGVRVLIVTFLGIGSVFGGMQVSLAAFSESVGEPELNGVLYGIFAAGNMLSGIVCGAIAWKVAPQRRLVLGYVALALTASGLWAAHSVIVLGGIGLLVGMCIAPALITGYTLVEGLVPAGARTEAFTWLTGAVALGQAAAVTVAGQLEDRLWDGAGFLVPMAGTALALATLVTLRSRLVPQGMTRVVEQGAARREPVSSGKM